MQRVSIEQLNRGGISDSEYLGTRYSVPAVVGLDLHSKPGLIKVHQKLTKSSGSTVTEFVKVMVAASDGNSYHFSADSGKIWKCTSAFVWSLVHTTTPAAGEAKCLGALEYNGYIYWATQSRLHRITIAGLSDWTANAAEDWATFTVTDDTFHPMYIVNGILYIGDGYYVAEVDGSTFTANSVDIHTPLRVKCLGEFGTDLLIGTYTADTVNKARIYRWNTYSPSWVSDDPIDEAGVNAFIPFDNMKVVSAGINGNLYYYDGRQLQLLKTIPGTYTASAYMTVYPNAVANFRGVPVIGVSKGASTPLNLGVYSFGRRNANYPPILTLDFPVSQRSGDNFVLNNIEIGAILVMGNNMLVSWRDTNSTTVYGVDKLDWSNKLDGAYFESRLIQTDRDHLATFSKYLVNYKSLPASTSINLSYDANHTGSYTAFTNEVTDTMRKQVYSELSIEAHTLQVKVALGVSSDNAPEIEDLKVYISGNV